MVLLLTKEDIKKVFSMRDAINTTKEAFKLYSLGKSVVPLRTNINIPKFQAHTLYMPAYIEDFDMGGIKIVSVFPKNMVRGKPSIQSTMILIDEKSGEVCSILDGTYLTQLRTGAAQGAATEILSREDAKIGILFGAGAQALMQLEAMLTVRKFTRIFIFDINRNRAEEMVAKAKKELINIDAEITSVDNIDQLIPIADVITTVTTSQKPVFNGQLVKKGTHVNGVGSYTPDMQEIDEFLITRCNKIFVDSREAALSETGDFIIPMKHRRINPSIISGEIGEIISGKETGRQNADEISLFKTVGIAIEDLVVAAEIYQRSLNAGLGTNLKLER